MQKQKVYLRIKNQAFLQNYMYSGKKKKIMIFLVIHKTMYLQYS